MTTTVASAALALLVLYGAALIFLLQTVGDHYSPAIFGPLLRKRAISWAGTLVVIAFAALALVAVPQGLWTTLVSGVLLLAAISVAATACYRAWTSGLDRPHVVSLITELPSSRWQATTQQVIWTALGRGDVETVQLGLRHFDRGSEDWVALITWLMGHHLVRDRDWLKIEILSALLEGGLDQKGAEAVREPLQALLRQVLDLEDFDAAYEVVHRTMEALREAVPFTGEHGQIMCDVARALWLIGDYRGDAMRVVRIPAQLEYVKSIYGRRRQVIWLSLLERKDAVGIDEFVAFLCITLQDTGATSSAFSLVFDIIVDGLRAGVLSQQSIFELANCVGQLRRGLLEPTDVPSLGPDAWDSIVADLAYALLALGAPADDVDDMLTNAGGAHRGKPLTVSPGLGELDEVVLVKLDKILGKQPRHKVAAKGEIPPQRPRRR